MEWMLDLNTGVVRAAGGGSRRRAGCVVVAAGDEAAARADERAATEARAAAAATRAAAGRSRRAVRERRSMPASVPSPAWIVRRTVAGPPAAAPAGRSARPGRPGGRGSAPAVYPKIELHVHLEGTLRPATLLRLAGRNGVRLPADTVEGLQAVLRFTDFAHFIEAWVTTSQVLRALRRLPQRRRGLRGAGRSDGLRLPGRHLLAGRAGAARRPTGRRSSRATATAPRRRANGTA